MSRLHSLVGALTVLACLAVGLWAARRPTLSTPRVEASVRELPFDVSAASFAIETTADDASILQAVGKKTTDAAGVSPRKLTESEPSPPASTADHPVRKMIDRELPDASEEERQIWFEELRHLPLAAVEDLLKVRRQSNPLISTTIAPQKLPAATVPGGPLLSTGTRTALRELRAVLIQNLLNVDTVGYRSVEPWFSAVPHKNLTDEPGTINGLRWLGTRLKVATGVLEQTNRSLDLAITGPGWFAVEDADGRLGFTRNGAFQMNAERALELITVDGPRRLNPSITIPEKTEHVYIDSNGKVYSRAEGKTFEDSPELGTIQLARFFDDTALELHPDGLYRPLPRAGELLRFSPGERTTLSEGMLERANVDAIAQRQMLERVEKWLTMDAPSTSSHP